MQVNFTQKAIVINSSGKFLAAKNKDGKWDLPGGPVALPRLHSQAIRQEIKERVGVELWDYTLLDIDTAYDPAGDTYHIFVGYMFVLTDGDFLMVKPTYAEFGWFEVKEFFKLNVPLYLVEFVQKAVNAANR